MTVYSTDKAAGRNGRAACQFRGIYVEYVQSSTKGFAVVANKQAVGTLGFPHFASGKVVNGIGCRRRLKVGSRLADSRLFIEDKGIGRPFLRRELDAVLAEAGGRDVSVG